MTAWLKKSFVVAGSVVALSAAAPAHAVSFVGLFNTGVDGLGNLLADGVVDSHYKITATDKASLLPLPLGGAPAYKTSFSQWSPNGMGSAWITPFVKADGTPDRSGTLGDNRFYEYETTFNIGLVDPASAMLSGNVQSDNFVRIFLNNVEIGGQAATVSPGNASYFQKFTAFSDNGAPFQAGLNTLTFRVTDHGVVTGLRVGDLVGSAIPEPGVWAMMIIGFGLVAGQIRRRRRTGPMAIA